MKWHDDKVVVSIMMLALFFVTIFLIKEIQEYQYVSSIHSMYCYEKGREHGNIDNKHYYKTLEACNKPLK